MAIDVLSTIFEQIRDAVTQFVQHSQAWRDQIADDSSAHPVDQEDQDTLNSLKEVEAYLTKDVQDPALTNLVDLEDVIKAVDGHLMKAKNLYSVLAGVSQTQEAKNQESTARQSLKHLIIVMNEIRSRLGPNLFLIVMDALVGKGPQKIGNTTFPEVTRDEFKLTQRLFDRKRFGLDDEKTIERLIDSWETVIAFFVDKNKVAPSLKDPDAINAARALVEAQFFTVHGLLELLYDQLEANRRTGIDILSPII